MKRFLIALFAVFVGIVTTVPDAEARRFGGSRSFGMQRDSNTFRKATPPANTATPPKSNAANGAQPQRSSWMGPLAGLAAGLGLAALMSHLGLGEEFGSILLMALLAFGAVMLIKMLLRRASAGAARPAGPSAGAMHYSAQPAADSTRAQPAPQSSNAAATAGEGFDAAAFERQAKLNFIRLQAASDGGNLEDIREFTTPEVFAEISLQLGERGDGPHKTDVLELDAEVVDVSEQHGQHVITVRFNGLLREDEGAEPTRFEELWHLIKPVKGNGGWRVAGLQQLG